MMNKIMTTLAYFWYSSSNTIVCSILFRSLYHGPQEFLNKVQINFRSKAMIFLSNVSSYIWHSGAFLRSMYKIGQYHDWLGSGYCVCGVCSVVHTRSSVQHQTTSASLSFELRGEFPDWCLSVSASKKKGTYTCFIIYINKSYLLASKSSQRCIWNSFSRCMNYVLNKSTSSNIKKGNRKEKF